MTIAQRSEPGRDGPLILDGSSLRIEDVIWVARGDAQARVSPRALERVRASREWIDAISTAEEVSVYGVNTGFGPLAEVRISRDAVAKLARNLILSHSVGVGRPLTEEVVRAAMLIRANTLAKGYSGIRPTTLETLVEMLNRGIQPIIPEKGSVGASGDLAPLSHLALTLIGEGEALYRGERLAGAEAMHRAGLAPVILAAKEGLALNNGTSVSAALGCLALADAENLVDHAEIALAMTLEALGGASRAFDARLHQARNHRGQQTSAANVRRLLAGSELVDSSRRVQDAYSLRCAPQVLGSVRDALGFIRSTLENEINAVTDNPLIFPDEPAANKAFSGGNFHGEPLALALDFLGIAVAEVGSIAERRTFRLLDGNLNGGLPPMLTQDGGLQSGLMMVQYTAAALVSDNKTLAHPDSVDSIPTGANQEDHVSMSMNAARHACEIVWNTERIVAIEMLCAAQSLDFCLAEGNPRSPESRRGPGQGTWAAYQALRQNGIEVLSADRVLAPDIERIADLIHGRQIAREVWAALAVDHNQIGEERGT
jgi:histidine ammonia-lyase